MKVQLLCLPCTVKAAYDIALKATYNEEKRKRIINETIKWLAKNPYVLRVTPAGLHTYVQVLARKITGNSDPFKDLKKVSNEIAMKVVPALEREVEKRPFDGGFKHAVLGTICGNMIDFEVEGHKFSMEELESSLLKCLSGDFALDDTRMLMMALGKAKNILYLLDNAGEIAFDKFFIKVIRDNYPVKVWAVVKSGPILNDATLEDAEQVRLDEVAEVITTGNNHVGVNLEDSSEEFLRHLKEADLIIAKGQGHYESLTEIEHFVQKPIFYILRAKCTEVAKALDVPLYGNVVKIVT